MTDAQFEKAISIKSKLMKYYGVCISAASGEEVLSFTLPDKYLDLNDLQDISALAAEYFILRREPQNDSI